MGGSSVGVRQGLLALAGKNHSSAGDQIVYPFGSGFFATFVVISVRQLLHRNLVWGTPEPETTSVDQGVNAEDDGRLDNPPEALPNP